jgi:hypothetical protein
MKNLPSKRESRDSLAREHTCQSNIMTLQPHGLIAIAAG